MKRGRMQCKDIPDASVIYAIQNALYPQWVFEQHPSFVNGVPDDYWRNWWWVWPIFHRCWPEVPEILFYAKVDSMNRRGVVHACVHRPYNKGQCRGDLHLPGIEGHCC